MKEVKIKSGILKLFTFLLLAPAIDFGQTFEVGANGGVSVHTLPINNIYRLQDKPTLSYALGAKVDLKLPNAQIGIGFEMVNLAEYNYLIPDYTARQYNYLAKPLITPYAFINKVRNYGGYGYIYGGFMLGPAVASVGVDTWETNGNGKVTGYSTAYNGTIGFTTGLQIGGIFNLNKRLALNLEAAARYTDFTYVIPNNKQYDNPYIYKVLYFPFTAGLRYRI